ncbi:kelch-like protein 3 [Metopolophium dirhodum]|uniref:kelch-like protein 3 n=1 Tax=Metopolophium dirhodum TaxID=44670 RepID=UPI00298F7921|nr:kelch-like protein 3 [Metopolophium dirhodum]
MDISMETPDRGTIPLKSNRYPEDDIEIALTSKGLKYKGKNEPLQLNECTMDVSLVVNNQKLYAHKNVLASNCDYFDRMFDSYFKERFQDKIEINITDVSFEMLSTLVQFFYSSEIYITENNVQDLLTSSNMFLLDEVQTACVNYIKTLIDVENCIDMKDFANALGLNDLYSICMTYIINNFRFVANSKEFMKTNYDEIMLLIKNDDLFAKEDMVYDVVMNWIKYDPVTRYKYSSELLWYIRLPLFINTYQGVTKVHDYQGAKIDKLISFRMEHRRPFRKGILVINHYPVESTLEWYDAALDQWQDCKCENCHSIIFQYWLLPPRTLCTVILLNDGRLFAAGGSRQGNGIKSTYIFNLKRNRWISFKDMHYERLKPFIVQFGSYVYAIGGFTSEQQDASAIECFDLQKNEWFVINCEIDIIKTFKNDYYVASVKGLIYIIGINEAGYYDSRNHNWKYIDPIPEFNIGSAVCTLNGNIYFIGGERLEKCYKSVWAYCTLTEEWVSLSELNYARSFSGAVAMNGNIYVFGGHTINMSYSNTFEIYNPHDNNWKSSKAYMKKDQCYIDAIVIEKNSELFKKVFEEATNTIIH